MGVKHLSPGYSNSLPSRRTRIEFKQVCEQEYKRTMARTRNSVKRQKVESALFNPDVVFLLAALLDARDLCQVSLSCNALGGKKAAHNGLSLVEEAARRLLECSSEWERSCLPKYNDEGWIELYHHLLQLRSKLTFDQLVGGNILLNREDQSSVRTYPGQLSESTALCSDHIMRAGKHVAAFTQEGSGMIGIIRPVQINGSNFAEFGPSMEYFRGFLRGKRTERWNGSSVHCCGVWGTFDEIYWHDWRNNQRTKKIDGCLESGHPIGLLLDLDQGMLSVYQKGEILATVKDGLSGEYCWYTELYIGDTSVSIQRLQANAFWA